MVYFTGCLTYRHEQSDIAKIGAHKINTRIEQIVSQEFMYSFQTNVFK